MYSRVYDPCERSRRPSADVLRPHAEIQREGRADRVVAGDAEPDADADVAIRPLEDVRPVTGRVHPRVHDPGRGGEVAGAPGQVLAERPRLRPLDVAGGEDA